MKKHPQPSLPPSRGKGQKIFMEEASNLLCREGERYNSRVIKPRVVYFICQYDIIHAPEAIYKGNHEECIAIKQTELGKYIVVIYKEINNKDGFVITAFLTRKIKKLERRIKIWPI